MQPAHPHRILLVADAPFDAKLLEAALSFHGLEASDAEVCLVAPARRHVQERIAQSRSTLAALGLLKYAWIGDSDPMVAIADALHCFKADELVVIEDRRRSRFARHREIAVAAATEFSLPTLDLIDDPDGKPIVVSLERTSLLAAA